MAASREIPFKTREEFLADMPAPKETLVEGLTPLGFRRLGYEGITKGYIIPHLHTTSEVDVPLLARGMAESYTLLHYGSTPEVSVSDLEEDAGLMEATCTHAEALEVELRAILNDPELLGTNVVQITTDDIYGAYRLAYIGSSPFAIAKVHEDLYA